MPLNPAAPLRVTIDGRECAVAAGGSVLEALRALDIALPTLCHDPRLAPVGDCWSCAVEVGTRSDGATAAPPQVLPACHTPLAAGMAIVTSSEALLAFRRGLLAQLATRAGAAEVAAWPAKELHVALSAHGIAPLAPAAVAASMDASHPHLRVDMAVASSASAACGSATRCRASRLARGRPRRRTAHRARRLATTLGASACVGCGACVDTCPTAAIVDAARVGAPAPTALDPHACAPIAASAASSRSAWPTIAWSRRVRRWTRRSTRPCLRQGSLCASASSMRPERETRPLLRDGKGWRAVEWPQAIAAVAAGLRRIRERHGADAIGVLGSSRATNEENYLAQKFARVALGTHNVDCCARVCHAPTAVAMQRMLGTGAATNSLRRHRARRRDPRVGRQRRSNATRWSARASASARAAARA